jgi:uncharacterized protein YggU (UPF0235/DUF167 family)
VKQQATNGEENKAIETLLSSISKDKAQIISGKTSKLKYVKFSTLSQTDLN